MRKYFTVGLGLKAFSCCAPMRHAYRALGNRLGARKRAYGQMPDYYVQRVRDMLELSRTYGIVRDGTRVLELGTGWLHWEAMTMRLFFEIEAVLFDVWDNRQLLAMKNYLRQLRTRLPDMEDVLSPGELAKACGRIDEALCVANFEELYTRFGLQYVIEDSGSLARFPAESFDLVVSRGVLEHVHRDIAFPLLRDTSRILGSGGWALHSINIGDHLAQYDSKVHPKFYLEFPEWLWRIVGQNQVQYINRLQRAEWIDLFVSAGLDVVTEGGAKVDLSGIKLASRYQKMDPEDLQHTFVRLLLKKHKVQAFASPTDVTHVHVAAN
jgi:SAM-dependent methyltransferase